MVRFTNSYIPLQIYTILIRFTYNILVLNFRQLLVGHVRTFRIVQRRAQQSQLGSIICRIEDLNRQRCKPYYLSEMLEDMNWFGLYWTHGPDMNGE